MSSVKMAIIAVAASFGLLGLVGVLTNHPLLLSVGAGGATVTLAVASKS
ncbi:hypothetical protein F7734_14780 [Scytonema sp. UIC 10036]|nr:hypothetical protein [Scytonema sp. UIC 10036]MUG93620.1 hypothetical protein [Scytonema sp. UIC 10036]